MLRENLGALPEHERKRLRRVEALAATRLDATHPPTSMRRKHLAAHLVADGSFILSPTDAAALEVELRQIEGRIQRQLCDEYRSLLYC